MLLGHAFPFYIYCFSIFIIFVGFMIFLPDSWSPFVFCFFIGLLFDMLSDTMVSYYIVGFVVFMAISMISPMIHGF